MVEVRDFPNEGIVLRRCDVEAMAEFITAIHRVSGFLSARLIDRLDTIGGDPDCEPDGCDQDQAWVEWHTMRGSQKRGPNILAGHEDDEEDDPSGQCDEDGINTGSRSFAMHGQHHNGPGCPIADPGEYGDPRGRF